MVARLGSWSGMVCVELLYISSGPDGRCRPDRPAAGASDYRFVAHLISKPAFETLNPIQKRMLVTLAHREHNEGPAAALCFTPGVSKEVVQAFNDALFGGVSARSQLLNLWTTTATN